MYTFQFTTKTKTGNIFLNNFQTSTLENAIKQYLLWRGDDIVAGGEIVSIQFGDGTRTGSASSFVNNSIIEEIVALIRSQNDLQQSINLPVQSTKALKLSDDLCKKTGPFGAQLAVDPYLQECTKLVENINLGAENWIPNDPVWQSQMMELYAKAKSMNIPIPATFIQRFGGVQPKTSAIEPVGPASDKQMATLYSHYPDLFKILLTIPEKTGLYGKPELAKECRELITNSAMIGASDTDIYNLLRSWYHPDGEVDIRLNPNSENRMDVDQKQSDKIFRAAEYAPVGATHRESQRVEQIKRLLPKWFQFDSINKYLDLGCAEGNITSAIGAGLGLKPSQVYGCDLRDPQSKAGFIGAERGSKGDERSETPFTFVKLSPENAKTGTFPRALTDLRGQFTLVTALMVFHHMESLEQELRSLRDLMAPLGLLVVREHDCPDKGYAMVLDVMHGLYARVWPEIPETDDFTTHFSDYKSSIEWSDILTKAGFKLLGRPTVPKADSWNFYYSVWQNMKR